MSKYKKNLQVVENTTYSYNTPVATIDFENSIIEPKRFYSVTRSKHINYVVRELNFKIKKD